MSDKAADKLLKLKCQSAEDVDVVSALFQDALVRVRDLQFLKDEQRFVAVFNRFRWETADTDASSGTAGNAPQEDARYEDVPNDVSAMGSGLRQRVHAGVCFEKVMGVRSKNFPKDQPETFLSLLSIIAGETSATLLFADQVTLQVSYKRLGLFVEDLGEAWPTGWQPSHNPEI